MTPCEKPVSEQTVSEIAGCSWQLVTQAAVAVYDHPGGASLSEWAITILAALFILMLLGSLIRR